MRLLSFYGKTQLCRTRALVDLGLLPVWYNRFGAFAKQRIVGVDVIFRPVTRNMASGAGVFFEKGFNNAVFQRVKTHNHELSAGYQPLYRTVQAFFEFFQLIVDGNPQRLKSSGCRINAVGGFMNDRINNFGQFFGCLNGFL